MLTPFLYRRLPTVSIENHRWNITYILYIRRVKAVGKALLIEPRFHVPLSSGKVVEQTGDQGARRSENSWKVLDLVRSEEKKSYGRREKDFSRLSPLFFPFFRILSNAFLE